MFGFVRLLAVFMIGMTVAPPHLPAQVSPETRTVKVIGSSAIHDKNIANAREEAVASSLVTAVNLAALEILPLDALIHNFEKLDEILYAHPVKFVQGYKVLAEFRSGNVYRVMLEATVSADQLNALKTHMATSPDSTEEQKPSNPRILFLVSEQNLADRTPKYWWGDASKFGHPISENAMNEKMREKGFTVLKHGYLSHDADMKSPISLQPELSNEEAVKIGSRLKADVVIVGKSVVYKVSAAEGGIQSFSGTVSTRAIRISTGEEIASSLQTAVKRGRDETAGSRDALVSAGYLAGEDIASQIVSAWQKVSLPFPESGTDFSGASSPGKVELVVKGTAKLGNFVRFRKALTETPGIKDIRIRTMRSDEAVISLYFQGSVKSLRDTLQKKTFKLFSLKLHDMSGNALYVELVPK